jgi:hypothetical protein
MNVDSLLKALDNENNEKIMNETPSSIKTKKNDILQQLGVKKEDLKMFHKKLKNYKYCEQPNDVDFGKYIRWISLKKMDNFKLTNGGIICDMKVVNDELHIVCKNNLNRIIQINFNKSIIFQKLSDEENIILHALKLLQ